MPRRVFISYQHEDQMRAKGFNLLQWNKNVDVEFVGRHLLDPVDSQNDEYILRKVREQIHGTSVTVVLLGQKTAESEWVAREVKESLEKGQPNGVLAIKLDKNAPLPSDSPVGKVLHECGAEVIEWSPHDFGVAIERAARQAGRVQQLKSAVANSNCVRGAA